MFDDMFTAEAVPTRVLIGSNCLMQKIAHFVGAGLTANISSTRLANVQRGSLLKQSIQKFLL